MLNEREIRERVNRRLSGLHADERRRMRIQLKKPYPSLMRKTTKQMTTERQETSSAAIMDQRTMRTLSLAA